MSRNRGEGASCLASCQLTMLLQFPNEQASHQHRLHFTRVVRVVLFTVPFVQLNPFLRHRRNTSKYPDGLSTNSPASRSIGSGVEWTIRRQDTFLTVCSPEFLDTMCQHFQTRGSDFIVLHWSLKELRDLLLNSIDDFILGSSFAFHVESATGRDYARVSFVEQVRSESFPAYR